MTQDEAIDELCKLPKDSPMSEVVVSTEQEFDKAVEVHKQMGKRLAAVSHAGLKDPQRRLTFLPNSAFTDSADG